jgi:hypothetical protein
MLVGEADAGPDFSLEQDLELTSAFGPDQLSDVISKYKSGNLVDAFRAATVPANDTELTGSFSSAILVKTNVSVKASGNLPKGAGSWSALADKSYGKLGNGITFQSLVSTAEVAPTTGLYTFIPPVGTVGWDVRLNGGAPIVPSLTVLIPAGTTPAVFAAGTITGFTVAGGANRNLLTSVGGRTVALTVPNLATAPNTILLTVSTTWDNIPTAGDTLMIPLLSVYAGTLANVGAYVITAATSSTITATKLSEVNKTAAVPGAALVAQLAVVATAPSATPVSDLAVYAPVSITVTAGSVIDGVGKSAEIVELTSGTDLLSRTAYQLGTTTPATWVSKAAAPTVLTSGTEQKVTINVNKAVDGTSESWTAGGDIGLRIGYSDPAGTATCTLTVTSTALTTTVGGTPVGAALSLQMKDFASIQALADFINAQTGYFAVVGNAVFGALPPTALDYVTGVSIRTKMGAPAGRIKLDAYRMFNNIANSALVQLGTAATPTRPLLGLPDAMSTLNFLVGGAKGFTTDALVTAGLAALESVRGNFVVPLFSRDAVYDIADGVTEAAYTYTPYGGSAVTLGASSYTIAGVHAATKTHVLAMSTLKRRRNRQAFLSMDSDFTTVRNTSLNLASFRASLCVQDFKQSGSDGSIVQFQSWMGATLAAAMQAVGFYRSIEYKGINTSGVLMRSGDFNPKNDSALEQALQSGLLVAKQASGGGYIWVSDQTTYGKDNNFVFNSIQAVYDADTVALTMAQRMEQAFIGQSIADISASVAVSYAEAILSELLRIKLLAPSDDGAPRGFKNLKVKISGNAMFVTCEIKLGSAIDFIKIDFLVSAVQQSA